MGGYGGGWGAITRETLHTARLTLGLSRRRTPTCFYHRALWWEVPYEEMCVATGLVFLPDQQETHQLYVQATSDC